MLVLVFVFCRSSSIAAHDFWVQPDDYWVNPKAVVSMTLQVGHGPYRQRSPIALRRITRFMAVLPTGSTTDLRDQLQLGEKTTDGHFQFQSPGTYLLVLETDNRAQSHLPAIRFNDYLQAEGLAPALELRKQTHRMDADGSENYSRCAKSIVLVGAPDTTALAQITRAVGLPLEIVPEQSPFGEPRSGSFPIRVIFEGQPLAGALVKLTNLEHDAAPVEVHTTDSAGRASFVTPNSGTWLLNVLWTKALPDSRDTDFETVFSSLSFGFPTTH